MAGFTNRTRQPTLQILEDKKTSSILRLAISTREHICNVTVANVACFYDTLLLMAREMSAGEHQRNEQLFFYAVRHQHHNIHSRDTQKYFIRQY